jgi:arylsulfatase A-like enzyme
MLAQIIRGLQAKGVLTNTIIIYTSDNGFSEGSHRWISKGIAYEESVRVPLILQGAGIAPGQTRPQLVNTLDVTATILDWAGAAPTSIVDGHSFRPIIANRTTSWRSAILAEGHTPPDWQSIRTDSEVYIKHNFNGKIEREFYDLSIDPYQMHNRIGAQSYIGRINQLRSDLDLISNCAGTKCWTN